MRFSIGNIILIVLFLFLFFGNFNKIKNLANKFVVEVKYLLRKLIK